MDTYRIYLLMLLFQKMDIANKKHNSSDYDRKNKLIKSKKGILPDPNRV